MTNRPGCASTRERPLAPDGAGVRIHGPAASCSPPAEATVQIPAASLARLEKLRARRGEPSTVVEVLAEVVRVGLDELEPVAPTSPPKLAYRDRSGRWMSEGRRLLNVVYGREGAKQVTIAADAGVDVRHVRKWLHGRGRPGATAITMLTDAHEIPGDAWGRAPVEADQLIRRDSSQPSRDERKVTSKPHDLAAE